jgi:hypothetical protein
MALWTGGDSRAHVLVLCNNRTREKRKFETVAEAVQARHLISNSRPDSSRIYTSTLQSYLTKMETTDLEVVYPSHNAVPAEGSPSIE